jgi:Tol biopolymer transport system component
MFRQCFRRRIGQFPRTQGPRRALLAVEPLEGREVPAVLGISLTPGGVTANGESHLGAVSSDGRYVTFVSTATNLIKGQQDSNQGSDVFLYDAVTRKTVLVSHAYSSHLLAGNSVSTNPAISADGRYIAYQSGAHNLVNEGTNQETNGWNIYRFDRLTGSNTLVSHTPGKLTQEGTGDSPAISSDGQWIAFSSSSTNLVQGVTDNNNAEDLFLYGVATHTIKLITFDAKHPNQSAGASYDSLTPVLSSNGRFVAYTSRASDLDSKVTDANRADDVFVFDRVVGTNTLISRAASGAASGKGASSEPSISADGHRVAFTSAATNLVSGQVGTRGLDNVFLYNLSHPLTLVSHSAQSGVNAQSLFDHTANASSYQPVLSADGSAIAYVSRATNLVPNQASYGGEQNVFLYHPSSPGKTTLVSHAYGTSSKAGNADSQTPSISADGRTIAFFGFSYNLVSGQTAGAQDVFAYDAVHGVIRLANHVPASPVTPGSGQTEAPIISGSGTLIAFASSDPDLISRDRNGTFDVFGFSV